MKLHRALIEYCGVAAAEQLRAYHTKYSLGNMQLPSIQYRSAMSKDWSATMVAIWRELSGYWQWSEARLADRGIQLVPDGLHSHGAAMDLWAVCTPLCEYTTRLTFSPLGYDRAIYCTPITHPNATSWQPLNFSLSFILWLSCCSAADCTTVCTIQWAAIIVLSFWVVPVGF